jgi:hypothetical protein
MVGSEVLTSWFERDGHATSIHTPTKTHSRRMRTKTQFRAAGFAVIDFAQVIKDFDEAPIKSQMRDWASF